LDYSKYTGAIREGDRSAFRAYMDASLDQLYRLVCRIIASEDDARDIVQETYIKLWEKRRTLKSDKSVFAFTRQIAINKCYDFLRAEKRRGGWSRSLDAEEYSALASENKTDDELNEREYQMILKALISGLSSKQQMVFTMSVVEKMSADEIADLTGLSKTSIKSNLYHARKTIKKNAERIL